MREMKDSDIEWLGDIPVNWNIRSLKRVLSTSITDGPHETPILYAEGIPFVSAESVKGGIINLDYKRGYISLEDHEIFQRKVSPKKGDIFIVKSGATTGNVGLVITDQVFDIWSPLALVRGDSSTVEQEFLYYQLLSNIFRVQVEQGWSYGTQQNISMKALGNIKVMVPPLEEQKTIIKYLHNKCDQIDTIIAKEQSVIEKLQEYKRAIITNAVVKGLDVTAETADSGIEWIDSIPSHWKIKRLIFSAYIRARLGWKGLKADEYTSEGHPFLSAVNIQNDKLVWEDLSFINDDRYDESPEIKLELGDLLLVKDGAGIGKCAVVDQLPYGTATTNSSLGVITPYPELNSMYLYYFFESAIFQNYISRIKNGMGVPHLTQGNLKNIMVVIPPYCEQESIVAYLDEKCANLDSLIVKKQSLIDKLSEYKQSLIYEVVTGKKEVSHV